MPPDPAARLTGSLAPATEPLSRAHAAHLLRRATFGPTPAQLDRFTGMLPTEAAHVLVAEARATPLPPDPTWLLMPLPDDDDGSEAEAFFDQNERWVEEVLRTFFHDMIDGGLHARMVLVWHNHLVTSLEAYEFASFAHRYLQLLRTHALGSFRDMVRDVGTDGAMLIFLNGAESTADDPNENYARELMELFTMGPQDPNGQPNYTENDVPELARALTGWVAEYHGYDAPPFTSFFDEDLFDGGVKTFLGRTGAFTYDEAITVLFEERSAAIAHFIAARLYRSFVHETPDAAVVASLAQVLADADFQTAPALQALLASAHFYASRFHGAKIRGPFDLIAGVARVLGTQTSRLDTLASNEIVEIAGEGMEQRLLAPPNVSGWPGYRSWLNSDTLPARWDGLEYLMELLVSEDDEDDQPRSPAIDLAAVYDTYGGTDSLSFYRFPVEVAKALLAVPLAEASIEPVSGGYAGGVPVPDAVLNAPAHEQDLTKLFLQGAPWYEIPGNADLRRDLAMEYLIRLGELPEFQLG
ncbi:MAG: DUF1800 domain-containing protein [Bacteroidota bacterium]